MTMFDRSAAVERALQHLRDAREDLKDAGATRAADKVRAAIKSTEGALRHADRMERSGPIAGAWAALESFSRR